MPLSKSLLVTCVVILVFLLAVVLGTAGVACALVAPHYKQLVSMIQQSELVMCCVGNLCKHKIINPHCPIPPDSSTDGAAVSQ